MLEDGSSHGLVRSWVSVELPLPQNSEVTRQGSGQAAEAWMGG